MFAVAGEQVFCDFEDAPGEVWTVPVFADPPAATFTGGTASYKAYCTGKGFPLAGRGVTAAKAWLVQKRMLHLSSHVLKASGQGSGVLSMPLGYTFDGTCGEVPFLPYSIYDNAAATLPPNIAGDHCNEDCAGQRICGYYDGATANGWTDADLTVYPDPEDWDSTPGYASCMYLEPADVKLDLAGQSSITAGGTGGAAGETVHTIAGVATVTASNPVYDDGVYYNMDNLFDGDTSPTDVHDTYWMAQNEAETTLTFRFPAALELSRVRLALRCRAGVEPPDFAISVSDGAGATTAVVVRTAANGVAAGVFFEHAIDRVVRGPARA
jgi:hypothetical protein